MKRSISWILYSTFFFACVAVVFGKWFLAKDIIGGDWPYLFREMLSTFCLTPLLWAPWHGNGAGGVNLLLGLHLFQSMLIVPFTQWLGLSWMLVYKIGWYGLFIILSIYSSRELIRTVFPSKSGISEPIAGLIYLTNSYVLMLVSGGQMGVALAYAVTPLVLASFIRFGSLSGESRERFSLVRSMALAIVVLGFQMMIDLRLSYITLVAVFVYQIVLIIFRLSRDSRTLLRVELRQIVMVGLCVVGAALLNAFWFLPQILLRTNPVVELGAAYTSVGSVRFFSFADFSHALSLLQPNWPENVFGKSGFLQPEFLVIPLVAFGSLLFINSSKFKTSVIYFSLLALIGTFFSKGAHEPFGGIYLWLFKYVPGFVMFRDPTKWYLLTVVSYSMLIPFTLGEIRKRLVFPRVSKTLTYSGPCVVFILFWIVLHRQAFSGMLPGTFVNRLLPAVYESYKTFISNQPGYFRTLWVPRQSRFTFAQPYKPAMEAEPLFEATNAAILFDQLQHNDTQERLAELGVRYVVVPFDALGELFTSDRTYDDSKKLSYEKVLDSIPWLWKIRDGELAIYETPSYRDLFWTDKGSVSYKAVRYDTYEISFPDKGERRVFFSQNYHPGWFAKGPAGNSYTVHKTKFGLMEFDVPDGVSQVTLSFGPQRYVWWGGVMTIVTLLICIVVLVLPQKLYYNR